MSPSEQAQAVIDAYYEGRKNGWMANDIDPPHPVASLEEAAFAIGFNQGYDERLQAQQGIRPEVKSSENRLQAERDRPS